MILFFIFVSSVTLILSNPLNDPESTLTKVLNILDICITVVFFIEFLLKVIAYGFMMNGKDSYLRNIWNLLDFIIVISSVLII